jgi:hypothetical protein
MINRRVFKKMKAQDLYKMQFIAKTLYLPLRKKELTQWQKWQITV